MTSHDIVLEVRQVYPKFSKAALSLGRRPLETGVCFTTHAAEIIDHAEGRTTPQETPNMREDMVKIGMGTADIRYRGEFRNWYADMEISYNVNGQYTIEQIINIINAGGYACGVGEWRPERDGQYGMFHVTATN